MLITSLWRRRGDCTPLPTIRRFTPRPVRWPAPLEAARPPWHRCGQEGDAPSVNR